MREIKFRGFDKKNNKWEIGYLAKASGHIIIVTDLHWTNGVKLVSEETVGQFTGLHDKNGKEIYEGDIIKYISPSDDYGDSDEETISEVYFRRGRYVTSVRQWKDGVYEWYSLENTDMDTCEVIGNIHENKNLLGGN